MCEKRDCIVANLFLDYFLKKRKEVADSYEFPQYSSDPVKIYKDYKQLIEFLSCNKNETYSMYWKKEGDGDVNMCMLFFTEDGCMITGIVVKNEGYDFWFEKLIEITNANYGYINSESPPPSTAKEFIRLCENSNATRLVDGELVLSR